MIKKIVVIINKVRRRIGYIDTEKSCFYTCRDLKNILWKFKGFGISVSVLNFLEDEGIENILISYNNKYYFSSTATFFFNGYEHINGKDRQMVLELDKFRTGIELYASEVI